SYSDDRENAMRHIYQKALAIVSSCHHTAQWITLDDEPGKGGSARVFYQRAIKDQVEALLVGAHGGSAWAEGLFGSFPRWLIEHSTIPVIVVPPPATSSAD
ncbi:MAG: universal stress protein, partial [Firmicutes bacterium]|nr:universal stress protein [Bacillota bacterium]